MSFNSRESISPWSCSHEVAFHLFHSLRLCPWLLRFWSNFLNFPVLSTIWELSSAVTVGICRIQWSEWAWRVHWCRKVMLSSRWLRTCMRDEVEISGHCEGHFRLSPKVLPKGQNCYIQWPAGGWLTTWPTKRIWLCIWVTIVISSSRRVERAIESGYMWEWGQDLPCMSKASTSKSISLGLGNWLVKKVVWTVDSSSFSLTGAYARWKAHCVLSIPPRDIDMQHAVWRTYGEESKM